MIHELNRKPAVVDHADLNSWMLFAMSTQLAEIRLPVFVGSCPHHHTRQALQCVPSTMERQGAEPAQPNVVLCLRMHSSRLVVGP